MLLAHGESKAAAIASAIEGPVTSMITASALQLHRDVVSFLDRSAAAELKMLDYYLWIEEKETAAPQSVPRPHFLQRRVNANRRS